MRGPLASFGLGLILELSQFLFYQTLYLILPAGVKEITGRFSMKRSNYFFLFIIVGLCYIFADAFTIAQPLIAVVAFIWTFGAWNIATEWVRIDCAAYYKPGKLGSWDACGPQPYLLGSGSMI
jgi:uncharacterized membrane protein HdeD (DUF308 family)